MEARTTNAKTVLETADLFEVTSAGLQAEIGAAELGNPLDPRVAINCMRALKTILLRAEGKL